MVLAAHPLVESAALPVPPVVLAAAAMTLLAGVARIRPARGGRAPDGTSPERPAADLSPDRPAADALSPDRPAADALSPDRPAADALSPERPAADALSPERPAADGPTAGLPAAERPAATAAFVAGRALGLAVLVLVVVAGRFGVDDRFANIAPALAVGVALPLVVGLSAAGLRAWDRVDPWDSLGRILRAWDPPAGGPQPVWWAVASAALLVWFLGASRLALSPAALGLALALYTLAMAAGCLLVGRRAWLERGEAVGLLCRWAASWRGGGLRRWEPPAGATVLLGVLGGGLVFAVARRSALWLPVERLGQLDLVRLGGLVAVSAVAVLVFLAAERIAGRLGDRGAVAAGAVPAVASLVLVEALVDDRLWLAAQLVVGRASDPLGLGWDLFGTADLLLRGAPWGLMGRVVLQLLLLLAGHAAGVLVVRGREQARGTRAGWPAVGALALMLGAGVLAVTAL